MKLDTQHSALEEAVYNCALELKLRASANCSTYFKTHDDKLHGTIGQERISILQALVDELELSRTTIINFLRAKGWQGISRLSIIDFACWTTAQSTWSDADKDLVFKYLPRLWAVEYILNSLFLHLSRVSESEEIPLPLKYKKSYNSSVLDGTVHISVGQIQTIQTVAEALDIRLEIEKMVLIGDLYSFQDYVNATLSLVLTKEEKLAQLEHFKSLAQYKLMRCPVWSVVRNRDQLTFCIGTVRSWLESQSRNFFFDGYTYPIDAPFNIGEDTWIDPLDNFINKMCTKGGEVERALSEHAVAYAHSERFDWLNEQIQSISIAAPEDNEAIRLNTTDELIGPLTSIPSIVINTEITSKLLNLLLPYINVADQSNLEALLLEGLLSPSKIRWNSQQNTLAHVFRQLLEKGYIVDNPARITDWVCANFSGVVKATIYDVVRGAKSPKPSSRIKINF